MAKVKYNKQQQKVKAAEENSKFYLIVALATVALVVLMYIIFR